MDTRALTYSHRWKNTTATTTTTTKLKLLIITKFHLTYYDLVIAVLHVCVIQRMKKDGEVGSGVIIVRAMECIEVLGRMYIISQRPYPAINILSIYYVSAPLKLPQT